MFSRFCTVPSCDEQTDGQMNRRTVGQIYADNIAIIASHGKNSPTNTRNFSKKMWHVIYEHINSSTMQKDKQRNRCIQWRIKATINHKHMNKNSDLQSQEQHAAVEKNDFIQSSALWTRHTQSRLDGCIVLNEHNTVFASKRSAICSRCFPGLTQVLASGISIASERFCRAQNRWQTDRPRYWCDVV